MIVLSTDNQMEAHIVAGRLRSHKIQAWIHQEPSGSAFGITVGLLGEVRVLVHPHDYETALAILDSTDMHISIDEDTTDEEMNSSDEDGDTNSDRE